MRNFFVNRIIYQEIKGDLEGVHVPPGWEGLMPMYTVGKRGYPLSLEEGQRSCSLATYHWHGNTPLGARRWRRRIIYCGWKCIRIDFGCT